MKNRSLLLLAMVTVVVVIGAVAAVSTRQSAVQRAVVETVLFPELGERIDEVTVLRVSGGEESFDIVRTEGGWVVAGKADFPARLDMVRQILRQVAELTGLEAKTNDPERHAKLGLAAPDAEAGGGTMVALLGEGEAVLAELVVGQAARNSADRIYVRRADSDQAWLVQSSLRPGGRPLDWIETMLLKLPLERVRRVTIEHADGEVLSIAKDSRDAEEFVIVDLPEGAEISSVLSLDNLARALAVMRFDDVIAIADMPAPDAGAVVARYESFDGEIVTVTLHTAGEETWARFEARYDPAAVVAETAATDEDEEQDAEAAEPIDVAAEPIDVAAEVAAINAVTEHWAFRLPTFKVNQLTKRLDGLVTMPEPEPEPELEPESEPELESEPEPELEPESEPESPEAGGDEPPAAEIE